MKKFLGYILFILLMIIGLSGTGTSSDDFHYDEKDGNEND